MSNGHNGHGPKKPANPPKPPSPAERTEKRALRRGHGGIPLTSTTPLTPREERFIAHYLATLNPMAAAKAAGYTGTNRVQSAMAQQVLARPNVQAALQRAFIQRMERTAITQDRVLVDLDVAAHVDPSDLFDAAGQLLPLRAIPRHVREAIVGFEWHKNGTLKTLKLRINTPFHELLAKHTRVGVEAPPPSLADVPAFILPEGTYMRIH